MTIAEETLRKRPYGPDLVELVLADHRAFAESVRQLEGVTDRDHDGRRVHDLARLLAAHETAEEEVMYPALRYCRPGGTQRRRQRLSEEHRAKRLVARMMRQDLFFPNSWILARTIRRLTRAVAAHAAAEEAEVLPLLTAHYSEKNLRVLGAMFELAKRAAPTRAHPHGPDRLPGLLVAGPVVALVDRARDAGRRKLAS